jgi:hypothetical protein
MKQIDMSKPNMKNGQIEIIITDVKWSPAYIGFPFHSWMVCKIMFMEWMHFIKKDIYVYIIERHNIEFLCFHLWY